MPMCRKNYYFDGDRNGWRERVSRSVARELDVHVLAANAGAELGSAAQTQARIDEICAYDSFALWAAGWAAWYASGDDLV